MVLSDVGDVDLKSYRTSLTKSGRRPGPCSGTGGSRLSTRIQHPVPQTEDLKGPVGPNAYKSLTFYWVPIFTIYPKIFRK